MLLSCKCDSLGWQPTLSSRSIVVFSTPGWLNSITKGGGAAIAHRSQLRKGRLCDQRSCTRVAAHFVTTFLLVVQRVWVHRSMFLFFLNIYWKCNFFIFCKHFNWLKSFFARRPRNRDEFNEFHHVEAHALVALYAGVWFPQAAGLTFGLVVFWWQTEGSRRPKVLGTWHATWRFWSWTIEICTWIWIVFPNKTHFWYTTHQCLYFR